MLPATGETPKGSGLANADQFSPRFRMNAGTSRSSCWKPLFTFDFTASSDGLSRTGTARVVGVMYVGCGRAGAAGAGTNAPRVLAIAATAAGRSALLCALNPVA